MKRSRSAFCAFAAAGLAGAYVPPAYATTPQYTFGLGHGEPASHPVGVAANEFAAAVARATNGRVQIRVYPNYQLGSDASMISQMRLGSLQMSLQGVGALSAIAPLVAIAMIGFPFRDRQSALAAMDGALGAVIRTELAAKGLFVFHNAWENGFRQIVTGTRPIVVVEDLNGLKIRVAPSPTTLDLFRTLGAAPVSVDGSEIYTSLQTHLIDAVDDPYFTIYAYRLYEVQKFISVTNHQWSSYWLCVNGDLWKSLPADIQATLETAADAAGARQVRSAGQQEVAVADVLRRLGMKFNTPDVAPFRARLGSYYQRWKKEFGPGPWSALEQYSGTLS